MEKEVLECAQSCVFFASLKLLTKLGELFALHACCLSANVARAKCCLCDCFDGCSCPVQGLAGNQDFERHCSRNCPVFPCLCFHGRILHAAKLECKTLA